MIDQVSSQYRKPSLISTSSYDIYDVGPSKPGISGYDPEEPDMRGVFMARGPGKLTKDLLFIIYSVSIYSTTQIICIYYFHFFLFFPILMMYLMQK